MSSTDTAGTPSCYSSCVKEEFKPNVAQTIKYDTKFSNGKIKIAMKAYNRLDDLCDCLAKFP